MNTEHTLHTQSDWYFHSKHIFGAAEACVKDEMVKKLHFYF